MATATKSPDTLIWEACMATTHKGPINLNEQEKSDFDTYAGIIGGRIKQMRRDPSQPRPISFSVDNIPSDVTDQTIEALRAHFREEWGVRAHRRRQLTPWSEGQDPNDWQLDFTSHT